MFEGIFCWHTYYPKIFQTLFFFKIGSLVNISVKCHQRKGSRGEVIRRWRGCPHKSEVRARSPEMDELTCVPETQQSQQAAVVEVVVVGVEDPLQMSDTEQGDIVLETQKELDSSAGDIANTQDTHAAGGTQKGKGKKADKRGKKTTVVFSDENEQKLMHFLHDNEILYNKRLKNYKDRSKREAVWDKFCDEHNLDKDACQKWFQSQRTPFGKVTHMKSVLGGPQLTERQKWTRDNFHFLRGYIVRHL